MIFSLEVATNINRESHQPQDCRKIVARLSRDCGDRVNWQISYAASSERSLRIRIWTYTRVRACINVQRGIGKCDMPQVDEGIETMLTCWLQQLQEFGGPEVEKPDLLQLGSVSSLRPYLRASTGNLTRHGFLKVLRAQYNVSIPITIP